MSPTPPEPKFVGWHRQGRGRPWIRSCEGHTENEVWQKLLDDRPGGNKCVTPVGRDPNNTDKRR